MDNQNSPDRTTFIPILIGVFSVLGICLVMVVARFNANREIAQVSVTDTPYKFLYIGTEPGISTAIPTDTDTPLPELVTELPSETAFPALTFVPRTISPRPTIIHPNILTPVTATSTSIQIILATSTPTTSQSELLPVYVTYDDADSHLLFQGDWISRSVNGAYKNTLHVSETIGDTLAVSFVGQKIQINYQAGPSLGIITVRIDDLDFALNQANNETQLSTWESALLPQNTHAVLITHSGGGAVNIDSIVIPNPTTITPSPTATP